MEGVDYPEVWSDFGGFEVWECVESVVDGGEEDVEEAFAYLG